MCCYFCALMADADAGPLLEFVKFISVNGKRHTQKNRYKRHLKMLTNGIWQQIAPLRMDCCCYRVAIPSCCYWNCCILWHFTQFTSDVWLYILFSVWDPFVFDFLAIYSWDICFGNSFFSQHLMVLHSIFIRWKMILCTTGNKATTCSFCTLNIYRMPTCSDLRMV